MTLRDRFGRAHTTLRLSLTERCNLRCVYCMPEHGVPLRPRAEQLRTDEVVRVARVLAGVGIDKIRLTGGEPLARRDAAQIVRQLGSLGLRSLAMTTNGLLLPDRLAALAEAGLTDLTVSLDTLQPDRFQTITRRPGLGKVLAGLDQALGLGYGVDGKSLKINVVALRGVNEDEAADFAHWAIHKPIEVRFIEVMPFDGNGWSRADLVPMAETRAAVEAALGPLAPCVNAPDSTAQTFRQPGWAGRVGFVASMTAPFCAGCSRLRVTADGALKVCLFGSAEVSLRDALRAGATDAEVVALVQSALDGKHAAHAGMDVLAESDNRPMISIGG